MGCQVTGFAKQLSKNLRSCNTQCIENSLHIVNEHRTEFIVSSHVCMRRQAINLMLIRAEKISGRYAETRVSECAFRKRT